MNNIEIIIRESGLLAKYNCRVKDILYCYELYRQGFLFPERYPDIPDYSFIQLMQMFRGSLYEVISLLNEEIKRTQEYRLECEIHKANGTYDDWQNGLSIVSEGLCSFFESVAKIMPPIKCNNNLN